jgi:acetyl-CoA carboxylase biotin carboxyl carrier protein
MSDTTLPVLAATDAAGETTLCSPKVGLWSELPRQGAWLEPGSPVGTITQLRRRFRLVVPEGVKGRVEFADPARDARPVAYGDPLVRVASIAPFAGEVVRGDSAAARGAGLALQVVAPTDGVFYRAPSLDARPYVAAGDRVTAGQPVGLIEVMKTFNPIEYGGAGLPDDAEVVAVLVADGAEVRAGQPLVVVKTL